MDYLARSIVHRDVKLENFVMDRQAGPLQPITTKKNLSCAAVPGHGGLISSNKAGSRQAFGIVQNPFQVGISARQVCQLVVENLPLPD